MARLVRPAVDGRYVPDFLTPKPGMVAAEDQLDDQLSRVAETGPEQVRQQLRLAGRNSAAWLDRADRLPGEAAAGLSPATISHHLKILQGAGLVTRTRRGRHVLYARTAAAGALLLGGNG